MLFAGFLWKFPQKSLTIETQGPLLPSQTEPMRMTPQSCVLAAFAVVIVSVGVLQPREARPRYFAVAGILVLAALALALSQWTALPPVKALAVQSVLWGAVAIGTRLEDRDWLWTGFAVLCVWTAWDAVRMTAEARAKRAEDGGGQP